MVITILSWCFLLLRRPTACFRFSKFRGPANEKRGVSVVLGEWQKQKKRVSCFRFSKFRAYSWHTKAQIKAQQHNQKSNACFEIRKWAKWKGSQAKPKAKTNRSEEKRRKAKKSEEREAKKSEKNEKKIKAKKSEKNETISPTLVSSIQPHMEPAQLHQGGDCNNKLPRSATSNQLTQLPVLMHTHLLQKVHHLVS